MPDLNVQDFVEGKLLGTGSYSTVRCGVLDIRFRFAEALRE
jgi:hypothetical protein